jgi:hypothetical protein
VEHGHEVVFEGELVMHLRLLYGPSVQKDVKAGSEKDMPFKVAEKRLVGE